VTMADWQPLLGALWPTGRSFGLQRSPCATRMGVRTHNASVGALAAASGVSPRCNVVRCGQQARGQQARGQQARRQQAGRLQGRRSDLFVPGRAQHPPSEPLRRSSKQPAWQLVRVVLCAFNRVEPKGRLARVAFAVATVIALGAYERRVHPNGTAICLLGPRPVRIAGVGTGLVVVLGIVGAACPWLWIGLMVLIVTIFVVVAVPTLRKLPAYVRLRQVSPAGRHVYLHSLASTHPGSGAELLARVAEEADFHGWSLLLDAESEKLVSYYERFGFLPQGAPVRLPNGGSCVRMWRRGAGLTGRT